MGKRRKKRRDVREKEKDRELKKRKKERGQFAFELLTNPPISRASSNINKCFLPSGSDLIFLFFKSFTKF